MNMKTIAGAAALAAIVAATPAKAQEVSAAYNVTHHTSLARIERATDNSYAFVDLTSTNHSDLEKFYSEARFNKPVGKGFKVGIDINSGTEFKDRVAGQAVYSIGGKHGFAEVRLAKSVTDNSPLRFGAAGSYQHGKLGASFWTSVDRPFSDPQVLGEVQANYDLSKKLQLVAREEHYPWSGYGTQFGLKAKL